MRRTARMIDPQGHEVIPSDPLLKCIERALRKKGFTEEFQGQAQKELLEDASLAAQDFLAWQTEHRKEVSE